MIRNGYTITGEVLTAWLLRFPLEIGRKEPLSKLPLMRLINFRTFADPGA